MNEKNDSGFFAWIRRGGIRRTDDRWLGGVCGGLARYFGISPVLMRAIMLVAGMMFGFGLCFYALAWFLLPDERDGVIVCERLFRGSWDWSFLGSVVMLLIALWWFPWAFLGTLGLGALALWMLNTRELRRQHGYGGAVRYDAAAPYGGAFPTAGVGVPPAGGPAAAPGMTPQAGTYAPSQGTPSGMPMGAPAVSPTAPGPQPFGRVPGGVPGQTPGQTPAFGGPSAQSSMRPSAQASPMTSPWVAPQPAPKPRRARRRPAGPLIVALSFGAALISVAGVLAFGGDDLESLTRACTYWIGGVCVALGLLITVLGMRGRRAGGLIPLAWIAAFVAVTVMAFNLAYSYVTVRFHDIVRSYQIVDVAAMKSRTWRIDDATLQSLGSGVWLRGADYDRDAVTLDLTGFADGPSHTVTLGDGTTIQSSCPVGQIDLAVSDARVTVLLPQGCSYAFGDTADGYMMGNDTTGGNMAAGIGFYGAGLYGVGLYGAEVGVMNGFAGDAGRDDHVWSCDEYADAGYEYDDWYDDDTDFADADAIPACRWYQDWHRLPQDGPELLVNPVATISGQVAIRYPGDAPTSLKEAD